MENEPTPTRQDDPSDVVPAGTSKRSLTLAISMVTTALLLAGSALLPTTYVVRGPGPTFDTLGEIGGEPLITVTGAKTFKPSGQLRLTTVSATGSPDRPVPLGRVVQAWFNSNEAVYPVESIFPVNQTQEQIDDFNQQEMLTSQEHATVAALTALGHKVPARMTIAGTTDGSDAKGKVQEGDVVVALNTKPVETYQELVAELEQLKPGDVADLKVERDGKPLDLTITTTSGTGPGAYLGVLITSKFDFPIDVSLEIGNVGGASAGMMFALGIIDVLTPEDEAAGHAIAGTGTMSITGEVGPIGGIVFKMRGALRDGAQWFLAPESNCDEVTGNIPDGLDVVAVKTLDDARTAVSAIGTGQTAGLPTCS